MNEYWTFGLLAVTSFFTLINPLGVMPIFMTITGDLNAEQRKKTARKATIVSFFTLVAFAFSGQLLFQFFGISVNSLKIVGGVIFFIMGQDMLQARLSKIKVSDSEITEYVQDVVGSSVNIIWGNGYNEDNKDSLSVTIIATGFTENPIPELNIKPREKEENKTHQLELIIENPEMLEAEANRKKRKTTTPKMAGAYQTEECGESFTEERSDETEEKPIHNQSTKIGSNDSYINTQVTEVKKQENRKKKASGWLKNTLDSLFDTEDTEM